jgi:hypothetical protein
MNSTNQIDKNCLSCLYIDRTMQEHPCCECQYNNDMLSNACWQPRV